MIDARKHTLDSVKKLTDYSDFNLYKMDICYDYSIDKSLTEEFLMMSRLSVQLCRRFCPIIPSILKCRISGAVPLQ